MAKRSSIGLLAPVFLLLLASGPANAQLPSASAVGNKVTSDFKYLVNNIVLDAQDVFSSPVYVTSPDSALRSPQFYLVLAGAGANVIVLGAGNPCYRIKIPCSDH